MHASPERYIGLARASQPWAKSLERDACASCGLVAEVGKWGMLVVHLYHERMRGFEGGRPCVSYPGCRSVNTQLYNDSD